MGTFAMPHLISMGYAFYQLPTAPYHGYYHEYVWNRPGLPAGTTRVIRGMNGEMYLTTDHYHVYYKIFSAPGGIHTLL